MKCPACAASVNFDNNKSSFKCDYCQNQISIIKPISVNNVVPGLNDSDQNKFANYLSILEQSMKAGNYSEAYTYCNKALEINPRAGSLWENKAICSFWLNTLDNLTNDKALEIITYLNASRQNDPDSETYNDTASSISDNLYVIALYKYRRSIPTTNVNGRYIYSNEGLRQSYQCLEMLDICYQLYPRTEYLKYQIDMIDRGNVTWISKSGKRTINSTPANQIGFDAVKKREYLVKKIQSVEPDFAATPKTYKIDNTSSKTIWIAVGIVAIIVTLMIIMASLSSK